MFTALLKGVPLELLPVFLGKIEGPCYQNSTIIYRKKPQITSPMNGCLLFALNLHFCRLPQPECISAYTKHEIKNKEAKNHYKMSIICENTNYCYMVYLYMLTPSGSLLLILLSCCGFSNVEGQYF